MPARLFRSISQLPFVSPLSRYPSFTPTPTTTTIPTLFTMATTTTPSVPTATVFPRSHVGFDSITSQIERKLLKRGFQFNVMCVGMYTASDSFPRYPDCLFGSSADCALFIVNRPDRSWKVDSDQHHFRFPPDRFQGSSHS